MPQGPDLRPLSACHLPFCLSCEGTVLMKRLPWLSCDQVYYLCKSPFGKYKRYFVGIRVNDGRFCQERSFQAKKRGVIEGKTCWEASFCIVTCKNQIIQNISNNSNIRCKSQIGVFLLLMTAAEIIKKQRSQFCFKWFCVFYIIFKCGLFPTAGQVSAASKYELCVCVWAVNWVIFCEGFCSKGWESREIQTEWKSESIADRFRKVILEDGVYWKGHTSKKPKSQEKRRKNTSKKRKSLWSLLPSPEKVRKSQQEKSREKQRKTEKNREKQRKFTSFARSQTITLRKIKIICGIRTPRTPAFWMYGQGQVLEKNIIHYIYIK